MQGITGPRRIAAVFRVRCEAVTAAGAVPQLLLAA
jgi:hypothetical protein